MIEDLNLHLKKIDFFELVCITMKLPFLYFVHFFNVLHLRI